MSLLPNYSVFVMWGLFLASLITMHFLVFKPTLKILIERQKKTTGLQKQAQQLDEQTTLNLQKYNALFAESAKKGRDLRDDILKTAAIEQQALLSAAKEKAQKHLETERNAVNLQIDDVKPQLVKATEQLAQEICQKLIGKTTST